MLYTVTYQMPTVQQSLTPFGSTLEGGQHNIWYEQPMEVCPGEIYIPVPLSNCSTSLRTKDNPERSNVYNMARIWKAYCIIGILVDSYGDVPYSEAGQAVTDGYIPA